MRYIVLTCAFVLWLATLGACADQTALAATVPGGFDGIRDPHEFAHPRAVIDAPLVLISASLWGATYWDVDSTFRALDRCPTCYEGNAHMRPFVQQGKGATWGRDALYNAGITGASVGAKALFRKNPHWVLRHVWLVPPLLWTSTHLRAAIHNERGIANLP